MYLINDSEIAGDQIYTLFGRKPTDSSLCIGAAK